MNMLPNMNLIADSLGWAVLHSLWQGIVAAAFIYVVRTITRERASEARYFIGTITLCTLLFAFIGTFFYYYNSGAVVSGASRTDIMQTITIGFTPAASTGNPLTRISDFTSLIGVFWAACFLVLGIRYMTAFRLTHKLRTTGLSVLPSNWQTRFTALAAKSGVSGKVRAYISEHVSSPITFGFFKPIVLVPAWFFTGMSAEQCEAILLHELAHIRRHDYLTNILQIAIKTVFFYHPAVQFICKGLDTDREHACDDFAVMLTKNPESLATALGVIRLKAARDGGVFALSADGRDAPLMGRLKRLMGAEITKTSGQGLQKGTSRGLAATAMIGTALALIVTLGTTPSQAHPHKENLVQNIKKSQKENQNTLAGGVNSKSQNTIASPITPIRPTPPPTNYWISKQEHAATQARAERANERRKAALERAKKTREVAWVQAREARIDAKAQRKLATKLREKSLERATKNRHLRKQTKDNKTMAAKERRQYERMRSRLIPALKADGYLSKQSSKVTIKMAGKDVFINGKLLSDAEEKKYCNIISRYVRHKRSATNITIKPNYFHVSVKRENGKSNYTNIN